MPFDRGHGVSFTKTSCSSNTKSRSLKQAAKISLKIKYVSEALTSYRASFDCES